MVINLAVAEFLFALILLIAAYLVSHTINGFIQTYVTSSLGDNTAKEAGLLTLNPLMHIDVFGFLALIFLGIGWFQTVPIDPSNFHGKYRLSRLGVAYATEALVSICIAVVALCLAIIFFGYLTTGRLIMKLFSYYSRPFLIFSGASHLNIADLFMDHQSSILIVAAFFLVSLVYLNILIAMISLIFNAFRYVVVVGFEEGYDYIEYADYLSFFGPFLVVFVFGDRLVYHLVQLTEWAAYHIAHLFGA